MPCAGRHGGEVSADRTAKVGNAHVDHELGSRSGRAAQAHADRDQRQQGGDRQKLGDDNESDEDARFSPQRRNACETARCGASAAHGDEEGFPLSERLGHSAGKQHRIERERDPHQGDEVRELSHRPLRVFGEQSRSVGARDAAGDCSDEQ